MSSVVRPAGQFFQCVQVVSDIAVCSNQHFFFSVLHLSRLQTPERKEKKTCLRRPVAALEFSNEQLPTSSPPAHNTFSQQHNRTHITHNDSIRKEESPTASAAAIHPHICLSISLFVCPSTPLSICPSIHPSIWLSVCPYPACQKYNQISFFCLQSNFMQTVFFYCLVYYCIISLSICLLTSCQSVCLSIHQSVILLSPLIHPSVYLSIFLSFYPSVSLTIVICQIMLYDPGEILGKSQGGHQQYFIRQHDIHSVTQTSVRIDYYCFLSSIVSF